MHSHKEQAFQMQSFCGIPISSKAGSMTVIAQVYWSESGGGTPTNPMVTCLPVDRKVTLRRRTYSVAVLANRGSRSCLAEAIRLLCNHWANCCWLTPSVRA